MGLTFSSLIMLPPDIPEKKTVLDTLKRPLHDVRISVIDRCNFRCPYCMPENKYEENYSFLKEKEWLTFEEIVRLTNIFVRLGVSKVRLTGGEPLLRPKLCDLIKRLSEIPGIDDLALTTNGSLLAEYAAQLKASGLKRLTVSLDSLNPETFKKMSGNRGSVEKILKGLHAAEKAGFDSIKINTVIQQGVNDDSILDLVRFFRDTPHVLRFIEYMDVGNCNHWKGEDVVPSLKILNLIVEHFPIEPLEPLYFGEVASRYRIVGGRGEIGFISSVSHPFCQTCTRLRLSAEGQIYTCLFASQGSDLKKSLRDGTADENLQEIILKIWQKRKDRYSELRSEFLSHHRTFPKVEMFQVGG